MSEQGRNARRQGANSHELKSLQVLNRIVTAITGQLAPSPSGIATEATLIQVLNAIATNNQDFEIMLVSDTGDSNVVVQQITDWTGGTPSVSYKKVDGSVHVAVGPLEYLDPSAVMQLVLTELLDQGVSLDTLNANIIIIDAVLDAIKIDTAKLDVNLSTRSAEATQLLIKAKTDNLDVALSTVATETSLAALLAKFGSLGQKANAGSAPVTLSTEQQAILTAIDAVLDTIKVDTAAMVVDLAAIEVINTAIQVATEGINTKLASTVRTPALLVVSGAANTSVAAGARAVTFFNQGPTAATVAGGVLDAGEEVSFNAGGQGDTLAAIAYITIATGVLKISTTI